MGLVSLLSIGLAFFVIAVSPGPANISNATIAMTYGRKASVTYGLGLSSGLVFWGLVAASGMGAILQSSLYVLMVLKVLGGVYLLWLAFLSGKSAWQKTSSDMQLNAKRNWFLRGLLLNLSNPKSVLAWMAALAVGLNDNDGLYAIIVATFICMLLGFAINFAYSLLFSMSGVMKTYQKVKHWVSGVVAGVFAFAGFGLIKSAFNR